MQHQQTDPLLHARANAVRKYAISEPWRHDHIFAAQVSPQPTLQHVLIPCDPNEPIGQKNHAWVLPANLHPDFNRRRWLRHGDDCLTLEGWAGIFGVSSAIVLRRAKACAATGRPNVPLTALIDETVKKMIRRGVPVDAAHAELRTRIRKQRVLAALPTGVYPRTINQSFATS